MNTAPPPVGRAFAALVRRDATLALRTGGASTAVVFLFAVLVLVPLGLGPDLNLLQRIAPGIIWMALLLGCLLTLDRLFQADEDMGALDMMRTAPLSLEAVVLAKCLAHWLTTALPMVLAAPIMAVLLNLDTALLPGLLAAMIIGSPALSFMGALGAALTVGLRRGGALAAILVLPLQAPVLIFAVAATQNALASGPNPASALMLLAAVSLLALVVGPLAAAAALRGHLQDQ